MDELFAETRQDEREHATAIEELRHRTDRLSEIRPRGVVRGRPAGRQGVVTLIWLVMPITP
ncbi:MAG: hypothetical protein QOH68_2383 [Nocardioidaceae bacterium]|nr:hypothetical protein [Nocardioidaceae bacterium]